MGENSFVHNNDRHDNNYINTSLLTISVSFTDDKELAISGYKLIPRKLSLDAYDYIFKNGRQIINSYGVTVTITIAGTLIGLFIMTTFAYAISRNYFPWGNQFAFFVFFTMMFKGGMVPTYIVISNILNLRDTIWALILPSCASAMYIMIMRTYMRTSIPLSCGVR